MLLRVNGASDADSTSLADSRISSCGSQPISLVPGVERLWRACPTGEHGTHSVVNTGPSTTGVDGEGDIHPIADTLPTGPSTTEDGCCTQVVPCVSVDSTLSPGMNGVQSPEPATSKSSTQNLAPCSMGVSRAPCVEDQLHELATMANLLEVDLPRVETVNGAVNDQVVQQPVVS
ncbi:hypothetical protein V6N11_049330 [Hibiscus sabdariffa]|uniref:Uncharacterized protein n=2 Tax=Hibiscus sabdariffa TaxID=183260 RepID=A0ABR2BQ14_9ROSI